MRLRIEAWPRRAMNSFFGEVGVGWSIRMTSFHREVAVTRHCEGLLLDTSLFPAACCKASSPRTHHSTVTDFARLRG
jgi:hypothetical protein